jgi:hypothetical protein
LVLKATMLLLMVGPRDRQYTPPPYVALLPRRVLLLMVAEEYEHSNAAARAPEPHEPHFSMMYTIVNTCSSR